MKRTLKQLSNLRMNKGILLCTLFFAAFILGRLSKLERVNFIHNSGQIENLIVSMDQGGNEELLSTKYQPNKIDSISSQRIGTNLVSFSFTYLRNGDELPKLSPEQLSLTSRNPVTRIYNKVARTNQLRRELNDEPQFSAILLRPASLRVECLPGISEEDALRRLEEDLDKELIRLEQMLAGDLSNNNPLLAKRNLSLAPCLPF